MAWSVDRLGRSLQDLVKFLSEIHALKVDLYLHQQGLDTTTPAGKAMNAAGDALNVSNKWPSLCGNRRPLSQMLT